jgi:hypothetical protein
MKNIENKVIWQPIYRPRIFEFEVVLDRDFVMEMLNTKTSIKRQNYVNDLAAELLNINKNPYQFYRDSCFVSRFSMNDNEAWLTGDCPIEHYFKNKSKPIKYYSHNVDDSDKAYNLFALVSLWVRYANNLKGLKKIRNN